MGEARGLGGRRVRLAARPSPLRLRLPRPPAPPLVVPAPRRCGGRAAILGTKRYARRPRPADAAAGRGPIGFAPCPRSPPPLDADGVARGGQKPARPRPGSAAPPLCPLAAVVPGQRRRAAPPRGARRPIVLSRWRPAPPGPLRRRRPGPRQSARANKEGGLASGAAQPRPLRARPLRPAPPFCIRGAGPFGLRCGGFVRAAGLDIVSPLTRATISCVSYRSKQHWTVMLVTSFVPILCARPKGGLKKSCNVILSFL